jgi:hypothetical protein
VVNKARNIIFCLLLSLLSSCDNSISYLFTYQSSLRIIERQDHQKCVSQGLDYGEWDEIITEMYWRCRYNLVMARKVDDAVDAATMRNNAVIDKISEEILKNLTRAKYSVLAKIEDDIELTDHNKCVAMGNKLGIGESSDGYYRCRQNLILSRIPPAPKVTNVFETAVMPEGKSKEYLEMAENDRKSGKESAAVMELLHKYPNCMALNIESEDFKKCSAATDESRQCLANVPSLRIKKEMEDKIYCQQQAFVQFPDNYALAKDKSRTEIAKLREEIKKDKGEKINRENNATLLYLEGEKNVSNIGRDEEFSGDDEKKYKERIYGKVELLRVRERFIYQCNKKMDEKLPEFVSQANEDCGKIAKNWASK